MLKITKSTIMTGRVIIEGHDVLYLNATITENGDSNVSRTINRKDLYDKHLKDCKKDIESFEKEVKALEESISTG